MSGANTKSKNYWKKLSNSIVSQEDTTNKRIDMSQYDAKFILDNIDNNADIIDIGGGSGLVINRIHDQVKSITAVETFDGLSRFIVDVPNVLVINAELVNFVIRKQYDCAVLTGVSQFFNTKDIHA